jgi:hypothetical protein
LPRVYVKDQKLSDYDELKRVSSSSVILTSKDIDPRTSLGNTVLQVGGLHILNGYLVINGPTALMKSPDNSSEPMLLVNGAEVITYADMHETSPVLATLNSLDPNSIDFIEILKGSEGARYGLRGGNGVILVHTSNKTRQFTQKAGNITTFYAKGITMPVLYPITSYAENDTISSALNDDPLTLFWSGNYFTDKPNNVISFYTNDISTTYKVTVTGITSRGYFIYKTITFQTK